jgi:hypothetical protein
MGKERRLEIVVAGDPSGGLRAIGAVEGRASKFSQNMGKVGGVIAGAFAVDKITSFAGSMLGLGNQVDVYRKKAATVFEDQLSSVRSWADANAAAMGLTDDRLIGLAASFGDLLKPMGFTAGQAADMSTKVVGLAGALSAWSGGQISSAEASDVLAKAMLGERDGLKALGIAISDADVQNRLAAKGQKDLTGQALEQAKAVATQELIFEKSTDAQRAWADGTFEAQQQQNRLKERVGELKERIAAGLMPVFQGATAFILDTALPAVGSFADTLQRWAPVLGVIAAVIGVLFLPSLVAMGAAAVVSAGQTAALWLMYKVEAVKAALAHSAAAAIQIANFVATAAAGVASGVAVAAAWVAANAPFILFGAIVAGLVLLVIKHWGTIARVTGELKDKIVGFFAGAMDWLKRNWPLVLAILAGPFGLAVLAITRHWDSIIDTVKSIPGRITGAMSGAAEAISAPFKSAFNGVAKLWNSTVGKLSFKVPGWVPGIGGKGFDVPDIPVLHTGGRFRAPTPGGEGLALLRDGEEVVTPEQVAAARASRARGSRVEELLARLVALIESQRPIVVEDRSGNPVETARSTVLALRMG